MADFFVADLDLISLSEVVAAVSVFLGFAPPSFLPAESSRKLDEVLLPNPFDRPRTIFMLEIGGIKDPLSLLDQSNFRVGDAFSGKVLIDSIKAEIEISDEDELSIISLNDRVGVESDVAFFDTELHDIANWLSGSYIGSLEAIDGELAFPLASGMSLNLNLSKKADWEFATDLLSLIDTIKRVIEIHEDFPGSMQNLAKLMKGRFTGIQTSAHVCLITDFRLGGELFSLLDKQPLKIFKEEAASHGHKNTVLYVKGNQNGDWVLTASKDQIIKVLDCGEKIELLVDKTENLCSCGEPQYHRGPEPAEGLRNIGADAFYCYTAHQRSIEETTPLETMAIIGNKEIIDINQESVSGVDEMTTQEAEPDYDEDQDEFSFIQYSGGFN